MGGGSTLYTIWYRSHMLLTFFPQTGMWRSTKSPKMYLAQKASLHLDLEVISTSLLVVFLASQRRGILTCTKRMNLKMARHFRTKKWQMPNIENRSCIYNFSSVGIIFFFFGGTGHATSKLRHFFWRQNNKNNNCCFCCFYVKQVEQLSQFFWPKYMKIDLIIDFFDVKKNKNYNWHVLF